MNVMVIQFKGNFANKQESVMPLDSMDSQKGFLLAFGSFIFFLCVSFLLMIVQFFLLVLGRLFTLLKVIL